MDLRHRIGIFCVLSLLPLLSVNEARADFLLQSARQYSYDYLSRANDILIEDVTADGIPDLVMAHRLFGGGGTDPDPLVATYPGLGNGMVGEPIFTESTAGGGDTTDAALVHLNGDGHHDLLLNVEFSIGSVNSVLALLGNGDGTFTISDTLDLGHESYRIVAADFTGDGNIDFGVNVNNTSGPYFIHWYRGNGDGTFTDNGTSTMLQRTDVMVTADFDGDGDMDVALGAWLDDLILLMRNDGTGQFSTIEYDAPSDDNTCLDTGDVNGDGLDDLAASYHDSGTIAIFLGNANGTFSPYVPYDVGRETTDIRFGDLDDDGDLDLTANTNTDGPIWSERVAVLLNDGTGSFSAAEYSFRKGYDIALHDMDGDGALDAVMNGPGSFQVSILLGRGDGTFLSMIDYAFGESSLDLSFADVDRDGDLDLVTSNRTAMVLLNDGDGTFAEPVLYDNGNNSFNIELGDLNGDEYPELITASYDEDTISILENAGDGTFRDHQSFPVNYDPIEVKAGDLDSDGDLDLAFCYNGFLGVLINPGSGSFTEVVSYAGIYSPYDMRLGDLDGDGDLDAALVGRWSGFSVLFNDGQGGFSDPQLVSFFGDPFSLVLFDLDGDSDLDAATGHGSGHTVQLLLNDGSGSFSVAPDGNIDVGNVRHLETADLDGDGQTDLLVGTGLDLTYLPGLGDGTFGPAEMYPTNDDVYGIDLADLDGNGSLDVAICGDINVGASILFNSSSTSGLLVTGPGPGEFNPTLVRVYGVSAGRSFTEWHAYGVDRWGVNVALGELDGTAEPEVLTGAGPGAVFGPHVRGFQHDGTPLPGISFLAYGTNKYGVNVCSGDLDNDGFDEIVTGAGPGAVFGPHVRGWNWDGSGVPTAIPGISYFAYGTPKWGVNVSCGDIDGDGYDEIVTGAGPGAVYGPHVRGWNCDGGGASSIPGVSFFAYGTLKYGVNVACGDIDGDGIDEMVSGAGPGAVFGPHVRGWNWDGTGSVQSIPAVSFFAYDYTQWGANVSCGDLDGDGIDEIITGPGPGETHAPRVRGWNYDGQTLTALGGVDFNAYSTSEVTHGVTVGGLRD